MIMLPVGLVVGLVGVGLFVWGLVGHLGTGPVRLGMLLVGDVMSRGPRTLGRNDQLQVADDLMRTVRCRHLPVVDEDGSLVGIVSQRDLFHSALLRALGYGSRARDHVLSSVVVKEVMTEPVITSTPDTMLADAASVMVERKIGCLPVVEQGALVGILTEGDFVGLSRATATTRRRDSGNPIRRVRSGRQAVRGFPRGVPPHHHAGHGNGSICCGKLGPQPLDLLQRR